MGFAWDVWGNGKTAVRGGFGLYHGLLDTLDYRLDQTAPFNTAESIKNIAVSDLQITPGTPPPAGTLISPSNVQPDIATPAVLTWSLRIEQQIAPQTSLTAGYVGSHSYHQILSEDMNEPVPTFLRGRNCPLSQRRSKRQSEPGQLHLVGFAGRGVLQRAGGGCAAPFGDGFQFRGNYTYSKNLDDGSAWNTSVSGNTPAFVEFPLNPKMDWGPAATDVRHAASINGSYELPFGPHRRFLKNASRPVSFAIAGWTASAIVNVQSGFPFSPQLGYNPTGNGDTRNPVRPNWNPDFNGQLYPRTASQYFNPQAFSAAGRWHLRQCFAGCADRARPDWTWTFPWQRTRALQSGSDRSSGLSSSTSSTTPIFDPERGRSLRRPLPALRPQQDW